MKKPMLLMFVIGLFGACLSSPSLVSLQSSFRRVSGEVIPSVVQVNVVEITSQEIPNGGDGPWDFFFPNPEDEEGSEKEFRMQGLGSGVILEQRGNTYYVLTNNHVIGEGNEISVTLYDKKMFSARLVGRDPRRDVALISFESDLEGIAVGKVGNSDSLEVGDWVLAVGNPFGLDSTVTAGIISGLNRSGPTDVANFIQTDASINQGNSGGALVNLKGEIVGINTWIQTPTGGNIGLGFAIPINSAKKAVEDLLRYGEVQYGWLGVSISDPGSEILSEYQRPGPGGAFVTNVYRNSPAFLGGILPGDLVISIDGKDVNNVDHMIYILGELSLEKPTTLEIVRTSGKMKIDVLLELRKSDADIRKMFDEVWPGFSIYPLNSEIRKQLSLDADTTGVFVVRVEDRTLADAAGLRSGDIIQVVNGSSVNDIGSFYQEINSGAGLFSLRVLRDGEETELQIPSSKDLK